MLKAFFSNPLSGVFIVITVGYLLGGIRIKGISLGSSAILFAGIFAGTLGITIPSVIKTLGLTLFIYSIGLQAGPKLRGFFKRETLSLNFLSFLIVSFGAAITVLGVFLLHFDPLISIGIFAGSLTSTPGLAAAYEATGSNITSIGYTISYPLGIIGVILFIKLINEIYRNEIIKEESAESAEKEKSTPKISFKQIKILNKGVLGKTLKELKIPESFGCVISRLVRGGKEIIPNRDTVLEKNDIVRVVGAEEDIERVAIFLGEISDKKIPERKITVMNFVVTNKDIVGKTIRELKLKSSYDANITRIKRAGIEIPASPHLKLEWGDRVTVVGERDSFDKFKKIFGDDVKRVNEANVFSIILGLSIGVLVGFLPVSIGHVFSFKLGITGGVLLSSLLLSNIKKIGPVIFIAPSNIVNFIRELGLVFFLSAVGVGAGRNIEKVLTAKGLYYIAFGFTVTLFPMILTFFVSRKIFNVPIIKILGLIPGDMTSTPGLAVARESVNSDAPSIVYATVYPVAMLSMIVWAKVLSFLL